MSKYKTIKRGLHFFQNKKGEYFWHIGGYNGKIIAASSEGFKTLASAIKNVTAVKKSLESMNDFDIAIAATEKKSK